MDPAAERYDRNIGLFGEEGQAKLRQAKVTVVGVGGLGSALVQHLAFLGVGNITLIDYDDLDNTNRNRFVGARESDPVPGSPKVELAARLVRETNSDLLVAPLHVGLVSEEAFRAVRLADYVFGCVDEEGARSILNELCALYAIPYFDLASDVLGANVYGGRLCVAWDGNGCLVCLNVLDQDDVRRYFMAPRERAKEDAVYGIPQAMLGVSGPAVSPVNGVIASLAATEFMAAATGLRTPEQLLTYHGNMSRVAVSKDRPNSNCFYCKGIRGIAAGQEIERYLAIPHLRR